ncbi:conjugal transfer protein [Pseudomonas sp. ICMP 8385]|uniref:TIGR03752 family integrating conjugative element protein n=1 Tax=Pseudomonas sp. ICMP 8385 TaxID=1718920 RepID=UPI000C08D729|nr:TIGR03752 family integrating conjugative element protein [Pseudomonas sp. ICMP 8385]PHN53574.1 conjugal transfer protein [Pseudomonas sp. ICMP 8385]
MKSNGLLKWLMLPLILLLLYAGVKWAGSSRDNAGDSNSVEPLSRDEMQALGIEGDTPRDTVATLVAQVKQLRGELLGALKSNQQEKAENERLRQREGAIEQRLQSAMQDGREQLAETQRQTRGLIEELQQRLESLGNTDLPVGLGLEDSDNQGLMRDQLIWIEPEDGRAPANKPSKPLTFPTSFGPAQKPLDDTSARLDSASKALREKIALQPVYTVPANATLMGSVAMTALIGRVPVDGTVNDPYPFKVLIGPDNLTANGIDLPEVAGAVVSGTASGDWALSCVRGQIRSLTFVFRDGTVRTVPSKGAKRENDNDEQSSDTRQGLGWISDPYGIPCVAGERRSNAQQYLGSQALITAAGAGAASLIQGNNSMTYTSPGNPLGTVGITTNEALGRILAGGVQEMAQWVNKLYGQAFAAVYVQPGAKVAVHIERAITVDYNPSGRRVDHNRGESGHVVELD